MRIEWRIVYAGLLISALIVRGIFQLIFSGNHPSPETSFQDRPLPAHRSVPLDLPSVSPETPSQPVSSQSVIQASQPTGLLASPQVPLAVRSESFIQFDPSPNQWIVPGTDGQPLGSVSIEASNGHEYEINLTEHEVQDTDTGVFYGEVAGEPGSHVVLAYVGEAVAGTINIPKQGLFEVRYAGEGNHRLIELDPSRIPQCQGEVRLPKEETAGMDTAVPVVAAATNPTPVTVEMVVFWTPDVRVANGGVSGTKALINAAIASMNLALNHSQANATVHLMYSGEAAYTETGNMSTDLTRLQKAGDGYLDPCLTIRDQYKADIISLLVHNGGAYAGLGYVWTPGSSGFAAYAMNVVVDAYADSNLTLAHETGHNMGCAHAVGDGGSGAYSYSYGWRFFAGGTQYRTVMAYQPGLRISYYSNPSVSYLGVPTGTSTADNARTIRNSGATIAALRTGANQFQDLVPRATGDWNHDGHTDILWRQTSTSKGIVWFMNGSTHIGTTNVYTGNNLWTPVASGDFNSDTKTDIVWRNTSTGVTTVWLMNGTVMMSSPTIWTNGLAWTPVASGDFNSDNKPDVLWRQNTTGNISAWLMNGIARIGTGVSVWTGGVDWVPVATGDFNGDGQTDILVRQTSTGKVAIWLMNGTTTTSTVTIWTGTADWVPVATGDLDGDGKVDIIWRSTSVGRVQIWYMNGTTMSSSVVIWG